MMGGGKAAAAAEAEALGSGQMRIGGCQKRRRFILCGTNVRAPGPTGSGRVSGQSQAQKRNFWGWFVGSRDGCNARFTAP